MPEIRLTKKADKKIILKMYQDARDNMKQLGFSQWKDGYPNNDTLMTDIKNKESFVFVEGNDIIASAMISLKEEITYNKIDGQWGNDEKYLVIHRFVVAKQFLRKGYAKLFLEAIEEKFSNLTIRIDTHQNNFLMKSFLLKNGFTYRGIIMLQNKELREAYDKF